MLWAKDEEFKQKMIIEIKKTKSYKIEIKRKKMRRMILRFQNGQYTLSVPLNVPQASIEDWLDGLDEQELILLKSKYKLKLGQDFVYLFGQRIRIVFRPIGENKTVLRSQCLYVYGNHLNSCLDAFLKDMLYTYIEKRIIEFKKIGLISFMPEICLQKMTSRYGVCFYTKRKLKFSSFLIHEPTCVIDSVIIHELGHFYYPNHSKAFYQWVRQYDKDYDLHQEYLKNGGAGDDPID